MGCSEIPQDPYNTFVLVSRERPLRVGVIIAPPYVQQRDSDYTGVDVELIKEFARHHEIEVHFQNHGPQDGFEALKGRHIDVLLGGLVEDTPYKNVGYSRPYHQKQVIALAQGENRLLVELERFFKNHASAVIDKSSDL